MKPLQADRLGTVESPIEVFSYVRHLRLVQMCICIRVSA
jgi:hypothetical protein